LFCDELPYGERQTFFFGGAAGPAVEFDVQCANFAFEVSDGVFFLLDIDPQHGDFFLHALDFLGILLVLFLEFSKQMVGLLLQILNHQLFFFLGIDDEVFFAVCFDCVADEIVVIGHRAGLEIDLSDVLLQQHQHVSDPLFSSCFLFQDGQAYLYWHVVGVVVGDEF
jgi:hypothetical protein